VSNATTVHVRRPGNSKKWRARVLCEAKICDLALLTVDSDDFWLGDLMSLRFVQVPELQVGACRPGHPSGAGAVGIVCGTGKLHADYPCYPRLLGSSMCPCDNCQAACFACIYSAGCVSKAAHAGILNKHASHGGSDNAAIAHRSPGNTHAVVACQSYLVRFPTGRVLGCSKTPSWWQGTPWGATRCPSPRALSHA